MSQIESNHTFFQALFKAESLTSLLDSAASLKKSIMLNADQKYQIVDLLLLPSKCFLKSFESSSTICPEPSYQILIHCL